MSTEQSRIARAIHAAADLLIERNNSTEDLEAATALVEQANALLSRGIERSVDDRGALFASEMIEEFGAAVPREGEEFVAFSASPYSGPNNAMRPKSVTYRRVGDEVHADVVIGTALEGAPGRAHGGATAAIFDDVMGAMQRVVGLYGYTRTLDIVYRAPMPTDELAVFRCRLTNSTDRTFTIEGEVVHGNITVATAVGVFTSLKLEQFVAGS